MSLLWRGGVLLLWFDMIQRQASLLRDSPLLTGRSLIKRSRERSIYSSGESLQTSHFYICFPLVSGGVQIWQHSYGCVSAWLMNESELLLVSVSPAQASVRVTRPKCHILWWWGATGRLCSAVWCCVCCSPTCYSISSNQEQPSARELLLHRGTSRLYT